MKTEDCNDERDEQGYDYVEWIISQFRQKVLLSENLIKLERVYVSCFREDSVTFKLHRYEKFFNFASITS